MAMDYNGRYSVKSDDRSSLECEHIMNKTRIIQAIWDAEASVYVATSEDIWGLAVEAVTMEQLIVKLKQVIPELIELNEGGKVQETPFQLRSEFSDIAVAAH